MAACMACSLALGGFRPEDASRDQVARRAVETAAQVLRGCRATGDHADPASGSYEATFGRVQDGLSLRVFAYAAVSEAEAKGLAARNNGHAGRGMTTDRFGPMANGTPSGRRIGQAVWRSTYPGGGPPRGAFTLVARDGASVVLIQLMHRITQTRNGRPVEPVFTPADLRLAETIAARCLASLTAAGYTSRSRTHETPTKSASAESRLPKDKR